MRLASLRLTGRRWRIAVAAALALAVVLYFSSWFPRGDAAKVQGSWKVVAVEDSGILVSEPFLKTRQYIFDGRSAIVRPRGGRVATTLIGRWVEKLIGSPSFRLDPTANPKAIDLVLPDFSTMRGIYDLDGDRLKICFSGPSGKAAKTRPTAFSVPGSGARLVILERDAK
jgi:uncharacterized protein (TIGR03067 family)